MPKKNKLPEASEEFWDALIGAKAYHSVVCGFCDRVHYSTEEPENYEKGELEELEEKSKENPDKYIEHSEGVSLGILNGKQAVYGCPCNEVSKYENLFWNSRYLISEYFSIRTKKELDEAKQNKNWQTK